MGILVLTVSLYSTPTIASLRFVVNISNPLSESLIVIIKILESSPAELLALTVNEKVPEFVGVPEISPVFARVRPSGKLPPVFVHVDSVPDDLRVTEYFLPLMPFLRYGAVVIDGV